MLQFYLRSCHMFKGSIEKLNTLIEYIENNLDKDIDYKSLSRILCVNEYSLHRIFQFITNLSLTEYIRKRKLTSASIDLLNGSKVIDVAIKYGYDSATSFGRAFKKMMGFSPKDISKNTNELKVFPVFDFANINNNFDEINYSIKKNISFNLHCVGKTIPFNDIPKTTSKFWDEMYENKEFISADTTYGIVEYDKNIDNPKHLVYHIGSACPFKGSKEYNITNKTFLMFSINSREAIDISNYTNMIYACVIPYLGYNLDQLPDIEEYVGETTTNIYIPITKK
ncbi:MAG: AraC family transcriptional regulator [Clostridiales bacterium]|nr:AraC family transcriptional regulator [Clostridiales bacterium]